ncbi:MAG: hypothetical protein J3K34DRAFT_395121 [Monoraphidium minutum]|nr:MAG: hypothetical protein J3K34DRAFT_395121 [Monoraphidium minutum]
MADDQPRGYLTMTVIESSGRNKDDQIVWEEASFDGFVKVELRGGARNVKVATRRAPVQGTAMVWNEPLVLDHANELRVMLCKDKYTQLPDGSTKRGTQVIAACGIYVSDILDAVPIDKYFELFKPGVGGEGGFIRLGLDFSTEPPQFNDDYSEPSGGKKRRGGKLLKLLLLMGVAAGGAVYGKRLLDEKKKEEDGKKAAASKKDGGRLKLW